MVKSPHAARLIALANRHRELTSRRQRLLTEVDEIESQIAEVEAKFGSSRATGRHDPLASWTNRRILEALRSSPEIATREIIKVVFDGGRHDSSDNHKRCQLVNSSLAQLRDAGLVRQVSRGRWRATYPPESLPTTGVNLRYARSIVEWAKEEIAAADGEDEPDVPPLPMPTQPAASCPGVSRTQVLGAVRSFPGKKPKEIAVMIYDNRTALCATRVSDALKNLRRQGLVQLSAYGGWVATRSSEKSPQALPLSHRGPPRRTEK